MKHIRVELATVSKHYVNADQTLAARGVGEPIVLEVEVYDGELVGDTAPEAVAREKVRRAIQRLVDEDEGVP